MTEKNRKKTKRIRLAVICGAAAAIAFSLTAVLLTFSWTKYEDYRRISSMEYDTVFLSMYPTDNYAEEDLLTYRAMTVFKASYCIPDLKVMEQYMKRVAKSGNVILTVYLGIRPDRADLAQLQNLMDRYPSVTFEVLLAAPSADYWQQLSQEEYQRSLSAWQSFLANAPYVNSGNFYFMGDQDWLISNPGNYENAWKTTPDISRTIMLNSDRGHQYLVTEKNASAAAESLAELTARLRSGARTYPDLSDYCLVFFGDSVIGNYTDSTSIPGAAAGLSGASVFNCGYGGNSAALGPDTPISLPGITEAFFARDLSRLPENTQVYNGVAAYLENPPANKKMCYIINYGLNDYFIGYPISSEDPYDIGTYTGALRTAVDTIRTNDPEAQILLCTPNFVAIFDDGTEPHGAGGSVLKDYADALLTLGNELQVDILDNYYGLGITHENYTQYLQPDMVHPSFTGRFLIADSLIRLIR